MTLPQNRTAHESSHCGIKGGARIVSKPFVQCRLTTVNGCRNLAGWTLQWFNVSAIERPPASYYRERKKELHMGRCMF